MWLDFGNLFWSTWFHLSIPRNVFLTEKYFYFIYWLPIILIVNRSCSKSKRFGVQFCYWFENSFFERYGKFQHSQKSIHSWQIQIQNLTSKISFRILLLFQKLFNVILCLFWHLSFSIFFLLKRENIFLSKNAVIKPL